MPHETLSMHELTIRPAILPREAASLRAIIAEYVAWLDMDLSYRGFDTEMDQISEIYSLPSGRFYLAAQGDALAACAGFLRHDIHTAELKRVYVRPHFRGRALGERLVQTVINATKALGFKRLILDAVPQTVHAQQLYHRMGFTEIAAYYENPVSGTRFFQYDLAD